MGGGASRPKDMRSPTKSQLEYIISDLKKAVGGASFTFVIDQGGGSFQGLIFADTKLLGKLKSKANPQFFSEGLLQQLNDRHTFQLLREAEHTFNDYSTMSPAVYPDLCRCLADAYETTFVAVCQRFGVDPEMVTCKYVRQTGKIRAVLHAMGKEAELAKWNACFQKALGRSYDYELLSNESEAALEAGTFFEGNADIKEAVQISEAVVGIGIGSSSTQGYAKYNGEMWVGFNSCCGAMPTASQKQDGKPVEHWKRDFEAILKKLFLYPGQTTLIALNAIGYPLADMCEGTFGDSEQFCTLAMAGLPVPPKLLHECALSYHKAGSANENWSAWGSGFILGFASACVAIPSLTGVVLERKHSIGKSLEYETSWVLRLVKAGAEGERKAKAQASSDSTHLSDQERNSLNQHICRLKDQLLRNKSGTLKRSEAAALAQDKWEKNDDISGKITFDRLRGDGRIITCKQWTGNQRLLDGLGFASR